MSRPSGLVPHRPHSGTQALIDATLTVWNDFRARLLTLRQLFYIHVTRGGVKEIKRNSDRLGEMHEPGASGRAGADDIFRDGGFRRENAPGGDDADAFLRYRIARQPWRVAPGFSPVTMSQKDPGYGVAAEYVSGLR